jgi:tRNA(Arg) A34 adenosine deaminase TadA
MPIPSDIQLTLPAWLDDAVDTGRVYASDDDKIALAIELSRRNVEAQTGGPFGAAIFGPDHRVVATAVNRVLPLTCSVAHAETLALMLAQQHLRRARLNRNEHDHAMGPYTLAASAQPCCQCYGAIVWGGIDRLLIGARAGDVMTLTDFDEGPLPDDWIGELTRRDIAVTVDMLRASACEVLRAYAASGGRRY